MSVENNTHILPLLCRHVCRHYKHGIRMITSVNRHLMLCLLLWLPHSGVIADPLSENFTAIYTLSKGVMELGHTTRTLTIGNNGERTFESVTKASGLARLISDGEVIERSRWNMVENYPRPLDYTYKNTAGKKDRNIKLLFDWQKNIITNIINGDPWKMKLQPGIQDKLLYQLSLMVDLQGGKKTLEYHVADGGKVKIYEARIVGKKVIETELGKFNTVVVQRKSSSRTTTFWCSPELNYLPVLIRQEKTGGGSIEASLSKLTGLGYVPRVNSRNENEE